MTRPRHSPTTGKVPARRSIRVKQLLGQSVPKGQQA